MNATLSPPFESPSADIRPAKIGVVNGLRGIAILYIIFHHLFGGALDPLGYQMTLGSVTFFTSFIFTNGYQGVALFFMLSGFVLTLPYFRGHRSMQTFRDAREFYLRRVRRLGPLYALCALISIIFVYPRELVTVVPMMFTMTFVLFNESFFPPYNWVLWSLAVEAMFSLLLPVVLIAVRKYGAAFLAVSAVILCECVRVFSAFLPQNNPIQNGIPGRLDDFMLGVLLAYLFVHRREKSISFALPLGLVVLFVGAQIYDLTNALKNLGSPLWGIERIVLYPSVNMFSNIGFFLCIDGILRGRHRIATWLLEYWPLQLAGLMSYSLYVWHGILIDPLRAQLDAVHVVRYLVMLGLLSLVTYRYVEFGAVPDIRKLLPSRRNMRFPLASGLRRPETPS